MPKRLSSRQVERILREHGFEKVSQQGSHQKFHHAGRQIIVPSNRKDIPIGTLMSIIRQSGLDSSLFQ